MTDFEKRKAAFKFIELFSFVGDNHVEQAIDAAEKIYAFLNADEQKELTPPSPISTTQSSAH